MKEAATSPAERLALRHLARGRTNSEIAVAMGLNPEAVRTLLFDLCERFEVASRAELKLVALTLAEGGRDQP